MIIAEENIRLQVPAKDWEGSLEISGNLLVKSGYIEEAYIKMTIDAVKELGPYIVIGPGLALAHSRPDPSVLKTGFSLITLDEEIDFGSELGPVKIVITLAATDNNSHIEKLKVIAGLLSDEENMQKICEGTNPALIAEMFNTYNTVE